MEQVAESDSEQISASAHLAFDSQPQPSARTFDTDELDQHALNELRALVGDDVSELHAMVNTFLSDTPEVMANMIMHSDANNFDNTARMAHRLKSSAAEFGALRLSGLCGELDAKIKNAKSNDTEADPENIRRLVSQINKAHSRACKELNKLLV